MICPKCGATNRDVASYCDSCGEPLVAGLERPDESDRLDVSDDAGADREPLLGSGGLVGWMAVDWFLRFAIVAVIGIVGGVITLGMGSFGFSGFFFVLGIVGIAGTWYMLKANR